MAQLLPQTVLSSSWIQISEHEDTAYSTQCCRSTGGYCKVLVAASACSDSRDALHLREDFPAKDAGKAYLGSQGDNAKKYTSLPSLQLFL